MIAITWNYHCSLAHVETLQSPIFQSAPVGMRVTGQISWAFLVQVCTKCGREVPSSNFYARLHAGSRCPAILVQGLLQFEEEGGAQAC